MPIYLCSPTPELAGFKLVEFKLLRHFRRNLPGWCLSAFKRKEFIKAGPGMRVQETLTMEFIARNTTIPVPRVLDVFSYHGIIYIIPERIHGPVLEDERERLSPEEQRSCMVQIKDCLDQLRALRPPHPERVQAVDGSGLSDSRLSNDVWGPFENHDELHRFLHHDFFRQWHQNFPKVQEPLSKVAGKKYKMVFSHGDFGPHNIIWRDGKIVIIDWETAGWFPEYWDYARAHAARGDCGVWWDMYKEVVDRYDDEVDVQLQISSYLVKLHNHYVSLWFSIPLLCDKMLATTTEICKIYFVRNE